ncbi:Novel toxin 15 [Psychrobacillus sp. OK032]|nr:Novel toxin 15 [Psychrobacillus sp. OK032]
MKGAGGNAIRSFYREWHMPFLQFFRMFSHNFNQVLQQMEVALHSFEPDSAGYILERFLEGELEEGLTLIGQLTASLTDETNCIMDQVSDIVSLPHLDDSGVQEGVINSKKKRNDTVTGLNVFDATQTSGSCLTFLLKFTSISFILGTLSKKLPLSIPLDPTLTIAEGRAIEGNAAPKMAIQEALKDKIAELRKQGLSRADATKEASEWLETKAALHNPDQIAGGRADIIGGLGDKRVNSSIGSQWKYRIDIVNEQIMENAKNMTPEQLKNTYLNVKLTK